jgi:hypothetical protein
VPLIDVVAGLARPVPEASLEDILMRLAQFGKPRVSRFNSGWYCAVDMHVATLGTSIEIKSDFSLKTPGEAVRQCEERLKEMLAKLPR